MLRYFKKWGGKMLLYQNKVLYLQHLITIKPI